MTYALIKNGSVAKFPYSVGEFRLDHPSVSLPQEPTPGQLEEVGLFVVTFKVRPSYDQITENLTQGALEHVDGVWQTTWSIAPASSEQIEQRTQEKADEVRQERNARLSASDWTQVDDAPVNKEAWAVYRQALRDISAQTGFPLNVVWPMQPV